MAACLPRGEPEPLLCCMPNAKGPHVPDHTIHEAMAGNLQEHGSIAPKTDGV